MDLNQRIVTVFGGTGFVGRKIVARLALEGWTVRVATRKAQRAGACRVFGAVGRVVPFEVDYEDEDSLRHALVGADAAVYSIGLLHERGRNTFQKTHVDYPAAIAGLCGETGVGRYVLISALACERGSSKYAQSKLAGENMVRSLFPAATILRPSIIFGEGDGFFSRFGEWMRYLPALPLIGGGHTLFQPVSVDDVAQAVCGALQRPDSMGQTYELVGPDTMSMRDMMEYICHITERSTALLPVPFWYAKLKAAFMQILPHPFLTIDQVESLKTDNIANAEARGLEGLGIWPTPMEAVLPHTLARFRAGGS